MDWLVAILLGLGAYLLGSIPTAYLLVYLVKGVDIRLLGTKNVGALNAFNQVGVWGGLLVLALDAGKGALAFLAPSWAGAPEWTLFLTGPLVVGGHNWPFLLGFRGGKGAAAIFGVSLAVVPGLTLITLAPVVLIVLLIRNVVWAAAFGFVLLNSLLIATQQGADRIALCVALTVLVTASYLFSVRRHIGSTIKARQWRELFNGLA